MGSWGTARGSTGMCQWPSWASGTPRSTSPLACTTHGELGDNTRIDRDVPAAVFGLGGAVIKVAAGDYHTCAVTSSGALLCWGYNHFGELGDGTTTSRDVPVGIGGVGDAVIKVTAGSYHTCAVTSSGALRCWGRNEHGQVGDGTTIRRDEPVAVAGLGNAVIEVAAGSYHTCAVTSGGALHCWGNNNYGQVGDGTKINQDRPIAVAGLVDVVINVAAGVHHTCALTSSGALRCWGRNNFGQLGDGSQIDRDVPVAIVGLEDAVIDVTAGFRHTCALTSSGAVHCWGNNEHGELGDGTTALRQQPTLVLFAGSATPGTPTTTEAMVGFPEKVPVDALRCFVEAVDINPDERNFWCNVMQVIGDRSVSIHGTPYEFADVAAKCRM